VETTLAQLPGALQDSAITAPALICVGRNVALRAQLDWQAMAPHMAPQMAPQMAMAAE
jgi:uroporphyrin-III C-methyltransferase